MSPLSRWATTGSKRPESQSGAGESEVCSGASVAEDHQSEIFSLQSSSLEIRSARGPSVGNSEANLSQMGQNITDCLAHLLPNRQPCSMSRTPKRTLVQGNVN